MAGHGARVKDTDTYTVQSPESALGLAPPTDRAQRSERVDGVGCLGGIILLLLLLLRGVAKARAPPALARRRAGPRVKPWRVLYLNGLVDLNKTRP